MQQSYPLPQYSDGVTLCLDELLCYRTQSQRWQPPSRSLWSQMSGVHKSRRKGRGMDFMEVRQYQAGDDIRSIDWRVTARTGKPHTKLFSEDKEQAVILYLDLTPSLFFGSRYVLKSVQMAHFAAVVSWLTLERKDRIGVMVETAQGRIELKPSARPKHLLELLNRICTIHNQQPTRQMDVTDSKAATGFSDAFQTLHALAPKGSEIIVLSDFIRWQRDDIVPLSRLARHNQIRFVQFSDPLEYGDTEFRGATQATDGKHQRWFNFGSSKEREALQQQFSAHQQAIKSLCLDMAISFSSLSSGRPLLEQISEQ